MSIIEILKTCKNTRRNYKINHINQLDCVLQYDTPIGKPSAVGKVYKMCCNGNCDYILKVMQHGVLELGPGEIIDINEDTIQNEVTMQVEFNKYNLAPKLLDAYSCGNSSYIIMEKMNYDVFGLIEQIVDYNFSNNYKLLLVTAIIGKTVALLDRAHFYHLLHQDSHLENFMINTDQRAISALSILDETIQEQFDEDQIDHIASQMIEKIKSGGKNFDEMETSILYLYKFINNKEPKSERAIRTFIEEYINDYEETLKAICQDVSSISKYLKLDTMKFIDFGFSVKLQGDIENDDINYRTRIIKDWSKLLQLINIKNISEDPGNYVTLMDKLPEIKTINTLLQVLNLE
jgi:serine/threonine protein kinase